MLYRYGIIKLLQPAGDVCRLNTIMTSLVRDEEGQGSNGSQHWESRAQQCASNFVLELEGLWNLYSPTNFTALCYLPALWCLRLQPRKGISEESGHPVIAGWGHTTDRSFMLSLTPAPAAKVSFRGNHEQCFHMEHLERAKGCYFCPSRPFGPFMGSVQPVEPPASSWLSASPTLGW